MNTSFRRALTLAPKLTPRFSTATGARARQPLKSNRQVRSPRIIKDDGPPRPSEIPFQSKVANSVTLIGHVDMPVQFEAAADGKFWAATVISRRAAAGKASSDGPSLWIPVIFEGDLAHVAASHLREKDHVCIEGQLIADPPPMISASRGQANVQVMVHTINFVEGSYTSIRSTSSSKRDLRFLDDDNNVPSCDILNGKCLDSEVWQDSENGAALQPKDGKDMITMDEFTHTRTPEELDRRKLNGKSGTKIQKSSGNKDDEHWKNLLDNPTLWKDYRDNKRCGQVKPRHPDFKSKDNSVSLWLSTAPKWFVSKFNEAKVDGVTPEPKSAKKHGSDDAWKSLVENPDKWWDNRLKKVKETSPDFRHKETGEALWLNNSPSWVSSKLPPMRPHVS